MTRERRVILEMISTDAGIVVAKASPAQWLIVSWSARYSSHLAASTATPTRRHSETTVYHGRLFGFELVGNFGSRSRRPRPL
jgi:hypothetical protein